MATYTGGIFGSTKADNLIAGTYPPPVAKLFDLLGSGPSIKRGTVLGRTSAGKYYVLGDAEGATGRIPFPWALSAGKATPTDTTISANNTATTAVKLVGNTIHVVVDVSDLTASTYSAAGEGSHKWLALKIGTGFDSILGVELNGTALTSTDVTVATANGCADGEILLWVKADEVSSAPMVFTLKAEGYPEAELNVKISDAAPSDISGTASAIVATDTQEDDTVVEAYVSGIFYRNMLTVAEGYTLTDADENDLRLAGILLRDGM